MSPRGCENWGIDRLAGSESRREAWKTWTQRMLKNPITCWGEDCTSDAEVFDHIKPGADGGNDHYNNLQPLCVVCHNRKTAAENSERDLARNAARAKSLGEIES